MHLTSAEVMESRSRGCWLVQNPRSNRGNRVGYPLHLGESDRVALGTDGYPSDGDAEAEALRTEALAHGEELVIAAGRVRAGRALFVERFGGVPETAPPDALPFEDIDREAAAEARRLWERMADL